MNEFRNLSEVEQNELLNVEELEARFELGGIFPWDDDNGGGDDNHDPQGGSCDPEMDPNCGQNPSDRPGDGGDT